MSFVAIGVTAGGLASAAGSFIGGKKQSDAAKKAAKEALKARSQANNILSQAASRNLSLPEFRAVDETGPYTPTLFDVFDQIGKLDSSGNAMPDVVSEIARSFSQDIKNSKRLLPEVADVSQERQRIATEIYDKFLQDSGLAPGQKSVESAINDFLGFKIPEAARREINRRSSEVAFRTGTANSDPSLDFANRLDYETRTRNFFAAQQAAQSQINQRAQFVQPGLDTSLLPAGGTSLQLGAQNFQLRSQAGLLNYQAQLDQNIQRFQNALTERVSNFERRDAFDKLRANILADHANAEQSRANTLEAASAQSISNGFAAAGQAIGMGIGALARNPSPASKSLGAAQPSIYATPGGYGFNFGTPSLSLGGSNFRKGF